MLRLPSLIVLMMLASSAAAAVAAAPTAAPFIDSKAIKERFADITAAEMDSLRQKKILFCSRSFGMNICGGLKKLGQQDAKYQLMDSYQRFNVFKSGGDLSVIPADAFQKSQFVHFICSVHPYVKRAEEMDTVLRKPPHAFAAKVDAVVVLFDEANAPAFAGYAAILDAWRRDFPKIRFIASTGGFESPSFARANDEAHAFGDLVRARYRGKVPIYDIAAIESDDFRVGHAYCPEYSRDPAGVHPNTELGETTLAKGFILALRDAFRSPIGEGTATASTTDPKPTSEPGKTETLPADHPEAKAVRAILDANQLTKMTVDGVSVVRGGHVVELKIYEAGVVELPDAIGVLTELETLYAYGDRKLSYPLLKKISPAIGKCEKLTELLLNGNDLTSLPIELASLKRLQSLSISDNRLHDVSEKLMVWIKQRDPNGLANQQPP